MEEKKEVSYLDKTYIDKRRILRQLSVKDEIREYLNIMTDAIYNSLISEKKIFQLDFIEDITLYHYIKSFLIDGYLSFEKIYEKDVVIDIKPLDPLTLIKTEQELSRLGQGWIQYPDQNEYKRVLLESQVIYISYSDHAYSSTSYVEELKESYEKVKKLENELVFSRTTLPGGIKVGGKITWNLLKRADKQLKYISKVPKSVLVNEVPNSTDVRYLSFIKRIHDIFSNQIFDKIK